MRHATWMKIEASPFWHGVYRTYRKLPTPARAPLRLLATPRWHVATFAVRAAAKGRVVSGPFRGMAIALSPLSRRHHCGYILGSQEREVHEAMEAIIARGYRTIIDVGAADGYYAVGLALRLPQARVHAFETLAEYRAVTARAAEANGTAARISLHGRCEHDDLRRALEQAEPPVLVFMDIEGEEKALLDPASLPHLAGADVFVETHDAFAPGCTGALIARFQNTHDIERYEARPRVLADFPQDFLPPLRRWFPRLAVDLMHERRTGSQRWLYMVGRQS